MIPYSYNMVDMGGIDLAEVYETVVEGLYSRIVEAVNDCGDVILYNWKFAGIEIAPQYTSVILGSPLIINGVIQVTELDQISVIGWIPPVPPTPVTPLNVTSNGTYSAEDPFVGFNPVDVLVESDIPSWLYYFEEEPDDLVGEDGDVGIVGITVNAGLVPSHSSQDAGDIAGQNQSTAFRAFDNNPSTLWTTNDRNYSNMYVGYNFNKPTICNGVSIMPRQWANVVQIHEFRVEGSNDLSTWNTVFEGEIENNVENAGVWNNFSFNEVVYNAYRLVALSLNTSVTFTIFGLQFNLNNLKTVNVYTKYNGHWLLYK